MHWVSKLYMYQNPLEDRVFEYRKENEKTRCTPKYMLVDYYLNVVRPQPADQQHA